MTRLDEIARALGDAQLDGWLFYDFRLSDPLAYRILGLSEDGIATRRWFCFVPAHGTPHAIVSAVEAHRIDALAVEKIVYRSHTEMLAALRKVLGERQSGTCYVTNVSGRGYCFVVPGSHAAPCLRELSNIGPRSYIPPHNTKISFI